MPKAKHAKPAARGKRQHVSVRDVIARWSHGEPQQHLPFASLLHGLGRRAFGMLLLLSVLPAFIPVPIGGAISGPLVMLMGAQLLLGRRRPWLPKWLGQRGFKRESLARFASRVDGWLARLERWIKPRHYALLDWRSANAFTGLLLLLLGLLLSLPIPFTNYLFGVVILLYALALLERDGALMAVAWGIGATVIAIFGVASGELLSLVLRLLS